MSVLKSTVLCLAAFLTFVWAQPCRAQRKLDDALNQRVEDLAVDEPTINLALSKLAVEYQIPIGVEMVAGGKDSRDKRVSVTVREGTLRDALNALTEQDTRYGWKVTDGVVNFYPKVARDPLLADLLATKVEKYSIDDNPSLYRIRHGIVELPEIKTKLRKAGVRPYTVAFSGIDFTRIGSDFSLSVRDVSLQELLNQIIRQGAVKFWILNRYGENNELLILNF